MFSLSFFNTVKLLKTLVPLHHSSPNISTLDGIINCSIEHSLNEFLSIILICESDVNC